MVQLGNQNSRMKDFYDIWVLSNNFKFEIKYLAEAVKRTFEHRKTDLSEEILAFTDEFSALKQIQWKAFRNKLKQNDIPDSFSEIMHEIEKFLKPVINPEKQDMKWDPEKREWIKQA
jgi:preprotein translocase subunit SecA